MTLSTLLFRYALVAGAFVTLLYFWHYDPAPYFPHPLRPAAGHGSEQRPPPPPPPSTLWGKRREEVKQAFVHAWTGYKKHARPHDELDSVSGVWSNKFNGWGVTLYDSLDTMWMMGLHDEFAETLDHVRTRNFTSIERFDQYAPFFETTIRYLGGLLSAYALSKEPIFLVRADDLGRALLPVFQTPSGFPAYSINVETGETGMSWVGSNVLFAEVATCQLEYKYLAKLTGRTEYYDVAENVMNVLYNATVTDGLFPILWSLSGTPSNHQISVGASGDSGFEYFLKQWLLSGDTKAINQYLKSINGIINHMLYLSPGRNLLYVTDVSKTSDGIYFPSHTLEHLSCFLPGLLALGAHTLPPSLLSKKDRKLHMWAAEGLGYTCYATYADMPSGLGPDSVKMEKGERWIEKVAEWEKKARKGKSLPPGLQDLKDVVGHRDYVVNDGRYLLRPETVESLYVLWRTTGDAKWRERGYEIFLAIEKGTKTDFGYASVGNVDNENLTPIDEMPSYFLAETLKYLYLLFDDDAPALYPLDKWIFNTEAHPLPAFNWTESEKKRYNIAS